MRPMRTAITKRRPNPDGHPAAAEPPEGTGWHRAALIGFLLLVAGSAGCLLSKPSLVPQSFSFVARPQTVNRRAPDHRVLSIRKVVIQAPFDSQSLVYRTGDNSFEHDPYAQFLAAPAETLEAALREYLRSAGVFTEVAESGSLLPAQIILEVSVNKLYGDFRNKQLPVAVMAARFVFFENGPAGQSPILDNEYDRQVPLKERTAAAVMAAWNEALQEIAAAAATDLNGRLERARLERPQEGGRSGRTSKKPGVEPGAGLGKSVLVPGEPVRWDLKG